MTNIGNEIKLARISKGLTQSKFGELLGTGFDRSQISNMEKGKIPVGVKLLNRISLVLDYEFTIVFDGKE